MGFQKILKLAVIPSISLIVLSFISIIITTHYWILGDWIMGRWVVVRSEFPEKNRFPSDDVIVDYTESSTQATIVSGCLNLAAGVVAVIAWKALKSGAIDTDFHLPLRRFYIASIFITCLAGASSAIASLATHYTDKGDDKYGCTATTGKTVSTGQPFTNLMCSREAGACNFVKPKLAGKPKEWAANIACNEAVFVKWLQLILLFNAVIIMGMFAWQSKLRRSTTWLGEAK